MEDEIEKRINAARWYHRYEILPGVWTPGICPLNARAFLDRLGVEADLAGKRALDIGTWDGPVAFDLERRGAEVTAIDVQDPDCTAFNTARSILRSNVEYHQRSVYELDLFEKPFDIICFFGVYYHLKHPIQAIEQVARALAPGGAVLFEGELFVNYSETIAAERSTLDNRSIASSDVPISLCYTGDYKGASNWFVPNFACLHGWFEAAGLEITTYHINDDETIEPYPIQRIEGVARRSSELAVVEEIGIFEKNLTLPDSFLRRFGELRQRRKARVDVGAAKPKPASSKPVRYLKRLLKLS